MLSPEAKKARDEMWTRSTELASNVEEHATELLAVLKKGCHTYGELEDALASIGARALPPSAWAQKMTLEAVERLLKKEIRRLPLEDSASQLS